MIAYRTFMFDEPATAADVFKILHDEDPQLELNMVRIEAVNEFKTGWFVRYK